MGCSCITDVRLIYFSISLLLCETCLREPISNMWTVIEIKVSVLDIFNEFCPTKKKGNNMADGNNKTTKIQPFGISFTRVNLCLKPGATVRIVYNSYIFPNIYCPFSVLFLTYIFMLS